MSKKRNKRNTKSSLKALKALRKRRASGGRVKAFAGLGAFEFDPRQVDAAKKAAEDYKAAQEATKAEQEVA